MTTNSISYLDNQSYAIPGSQEVGYSSIYRSSQYKNKLFENDPNDCNTIYETFKRSCEMFPKTPMFGTRVREDGSLGEYEWQTYEEIFMRVTNFSKGLKLLISRLHIPPNDEEELFKGIINIGIYSINRAEWCISDYSISKFKNIVVVALYDTYGPEALEFVINHAKLGIIISQKNKLINLLKIADKLPCLKAIVSMDKIDGNDSVLIEFAKSKNIEIISFETIEKSGFDLADTTENYPSYDNLYTICYTSGTTGQPKGAMLTHLSFSAGPRSIDKILQDTKGTCISYLPLTHCFERLNMLVQIRRGCSVGFYNGDIITLMDDIKLLKPCVFVSVPRLFNRIYDAIANNTVNQKGIKSKLVKKGLHTKLQNLRSNKGTSHIFWDTLIFNKIKSQLGGNIQAMLSGSAPLSDKVQDFLKVCFQCDLCQGYGLTETAAAGCVTLKNEYRPGHCGPPLPCCEFRLKDCIEMNYLSTDKPHPRGELQIRGPTVFKGYYKDKEKTNQDLQDGWFSTGDIAKLTSFGTFAIIDRKKNIFKLAQGEYIAPEKIEGIYNQNPLIAQSFVYGDSQQSFLVGVFVVDPTTFMEFANKIGGLNKGLEEFCNDDKVKHSVLIELNKTAKRLGLNSFEHVKKIKLEHELFTVENNLTTPTMKLKRNELKTKYMDEINKLYNEN